MSAPNTSANLSITSPVRLAPPDTAIRRAGRGSFQVDPGWCTSRPAGAQAGGAGWSARVEHDAGLHVALLDVLEAVVDVVELADLVDDPGTAPSVDRIDLGEVFAGADD